VEQVNKFKYLGAWIVNDGLSNTEKRTSRPTPIGMAKSVFSKRD